ncbi:innexin unc-9-like [Watersipora subatra]|uniref:innexin unc-9-like n=1 Tax=Watersipora subatra TaxID=2589382 RepID=UPI00355C9DC0
MTSLVEALQNGIKILKRKDDDIFDRLSNRYTIGVVMSVSLFLATKTYVGDPIDCFTPKEYHDNWVKYADNYCWIKNTYRVHINDSLPGPKGLPTLDHNSGEELPYYQWVPIILAFMLFVFSIPAYFWQFAMWSSGYDVEAIVSVTSDADNLNPEKRDEANKYIVSQLDRHISYHRHMTGHGRVHLGNRYGRYLFIMYVITKCLYLAVPIVLIYMLSGMMGPGFADYGWRAVTSLNDKRGKYLENPMFPRITYCDFAIRRMGGNIHRYTLQCVLSVNLFNEKVFLLLWWWLVVLAGLTAFGLLWCLLINLRPNGGKSFILKYLKVMGAMDTVSAADHDDLNTFIGEYLSLDGIFCMRLLSQNTTDVITAEIITALYKRWKSLHGSGSNSSSKALLTDETA